MSTPRIASSLPPSLVPSLQSFGPCDHVLLHLPYSRRLTNSFLPPSLPPPPAVTFYSNIMTLVLMSFSTLLSGDLLGALAYARSNQTAAVYLVMYTLLAYLAISLHMVRGRGEGRDGGSEGKSLCIFGLEVFGPFQSQSLSIIFYHVWCLSYLPHAFPPHLFTPLSLSSTLPPALSFHTYNPSLPLGQTLLNKSTNNT